MACDICGKTGTTLTRLLDVYKTDAIADICPECEATINKQLSKVRSVTHNILVDCIKRFMRNLKDAALAEGEK